MNSEYDVTILGGGLAGLTLALQVRKETVAPGRRHTNRTVRDHHTA